ncbi:MAG: nitronate monooxygenase [Deferrisomatales bacterium]
MNRPLTIGRHTVRFPLVQGGMGVRVSGGRLAGHVARCGGVGLVASAGLGLSSPHAETHGYYAASARSLQDEIRRAYAIAPDGVVGVNCMVAVSDYDDLVQAACQAGAKVVVSGAGLPLNLPALTKDYPDVALVPIVSSVRAAELVGRKWHKHFDRLPDAVVVEDPETAGGHLGEKLENIGTGAYDQYATVAGVRAFFQERFGRAVPVIAAGGIWDRADLLHALARGADGVQMATRFVCTEECDADEAFKQAYLRATRDDIGLIMSPAGLPGRALIGNVEAIGARDRGQGRGCSAACLKKCAYREGRERFCILYALDRAYRGDTDTGLVFCGSNAWRAERIATVREIFDELFELAASDETAEVVNG